MIIKIDPHTLQRAEERGATRDEIVDVIKHGIDIPAKYGRKAKAKVYPFNRSRQNKHYDEKRVEVVYDVFNSTIITVTVYVFYGKWEV